MASDGIEVTLESLSLTKVAILTTVSINYTLKNLTQDTQAESGWKLFFEEEEGTFFGFPSQLLPGQSINRTFDFNVAVPNGLFVFAYPADIADTTWDDDDLIWTDEP